MEKKELVEWKKDDRKIPRGLKVRFHEEMSRKDG